jgi:hypothetical protein
VEELFLIGIAFRDMLVLAHWNGEQPTRQSFEQGLTPPVSILNLNHDSRGIDIFAELEEISCAWALIYMN